MNGIGGNFFGRTLIQRKGSMGGARDVFVKIASIKNELIFPTFGGRVMNPFKGNAKIYAGDLIEYRTNQNGVKPEIYLLKTYKVKSGTGTSVKIYRDGYKHIPFVGDILMKAPDNITDKNGTSATVIAIKAEADGSDDVWTLTLDADITVSANDILVESKAKASGNAEMLVQNINAVAPCDYDFLYEPSAVESSEEDADYENARYFMTPALGGLMYRHKMSPIPPCVEVFNKVNVNGWFGFDLK